MYSAIYAVLAFIYLYDISAFSKINRKIVQVCFIQIPIMLGGNTS